MDQSKLPSLQRALAALNPRAPVLAARNGAFDPRAWPMILDPGTKMQAPRRPSHRRGRPPAHADDHDHRLHASARGIESFAVCAGDVASRDALQAWSSYLVLRYAEQLLRVKGFVSIAGEPDHVLVQGAFDGIFFRPWREAAPCESTQVVTIAQGMEDPERRAELRRALAELASDARVTP